MLKSNTPRYCPHNVDCIALNRVVLLQSALNYILHNDCLSCLIDIDIQLMHKAENDFNDTILNSSICLHSQTFIFT